MKHFSPHSEDIQDSRLLLDIIINFCFLGIFLPSISLPSDVQIVCSEDAQGGFNVTKHDGEPQFSLMLMYYHHLRSALLFPSALFFFPSHFFLLFHPLPLSSCCRRYLVSASHCALSLSLLLLLSFSLGCSMAGFSSFSCQILKAVCEDRDVHEGVPHGTCWI